MKRDTSRKEGVTDSPGLTVGRSRQVSNRNWALISFLLTLALSITVVPVWAEEEDDDVNGIRHRVDRLEALLADLKGTVSELEDPLKPEYVTVDCGAGQTVGAALAEAQGHIGPLHITVEGICEEAVHISRDDVSLAGASEGDGLRSPSPNESLLSLSGANRILLYQLTLSHGLCGVRASDGSSFQASRLKIEDHFPWGVLVEGGSSGSLYECAIENNPAFGVMSLNGGTLELDGCNVTGNGTGVSPEDGGIMRIRNTIVRENETGIMVFVGSTVKVESSTIERNSKNGIDVLFGVANVRGNSRVADNGHAGVHILGGSTVQISETTIEGNQGPGIQVEDASTVAVFEVTITGNGGDGITLRDMSNGLGAWGAGGGPPLNPVEITGNGGWGIYCGGPDDAIKIAQNDFALGDILFSGNTSGDTNCLGGH